MDFKQMPTYTYLSVISHPASLFLLLTPATTAILSDSELADQWGEEIKAMADRIAAMRLALRDKLEAKTGTAWPHVTDQIGMFCFLGLSPEQVDKMIKDHHVYMTRDGRISVVGLTTNNVEYVAEAIATVVGKATAAADIDTKPN